MSRLLPLALVLAVACKKEDEEGETPILELEGDIDAGGATYAADCAGCHAEDGSGGIGPSIPERLAAIDKEEIVDTIVEGRGTMPAWGSVKSNQEIADVVAYIYAQWGP